MDIKIELKIDTMPWAEALPDQKAAWKKLWALLLKENKDKATDNTK